MSGNTMGSAFRVTTWGESHGRGVGVVIDGCPAGLSLSAEDVQKELDRRRPGQSRASTARDEADHVEILSGVFDQKTTGCPISMLVWNKDAQSRSYDALKDRPRPGHADLAYQQKYGIRDHRGGGRASARETVGRVAAGAVAKRLLSHWDVDILGYVAELAGIEARASDWQKQGEISKEEISRLREAIDANPIRSPDRAEEMLDAIDKARMDGESVGGFVQIIAAGVPPGLGEPVFSKLDADLASALMSIGAVKAVEIGAGVASARLRGSEMNDSILPGERGPAYETNRAGGILGGISTGAPILVKIAVKPTPSIARPQRTVDLRSGEAVEIEIKGRHDPAIPPRIVPVAEAMVAIVLADHLLRDRASRIQD